MEANRLHPDDEVKVEIFDQDNVCVETYKGKGFNNVAQAIRSACEYSELPDDWRNYTFRVTDMPDSTTERYRINENNHVKLIV